LRGADLGDAAPARGSARRRRMRSAHPDDPTAPTSHRVAPPIVVAIDGPSGAGKSTVARALARRLGFAHLDSGALYRAVALHLRASGADLGSPADVDRAPATMQLELDAEARVRLDGADVAGAGRSAEVESIVSTVAAMPAVRARLLDLQRDFRTRGPLVCEGRDMGTVVFPDAPFKFWLDASLDERARRRCRDFGASGRDVSEAAVRDELETRDARDASRELAPLAAAADAVHVDTTELGVDEVVEQLARIVRTGSGGDA